MVNKARLGAFVPPVINPPFSPAQAVVGELKDTEDYLARHLASIGLFWKISFACWMCQSSALGAISTRKSFNYLFPPNDSFHHWS